MATNRHHSQSANFRCDFIHRHARSPLVDRPSGSRWPRSSLPISTVERPAQGLNTRPWPHEHDFQDNLYQNLPPSFDRTVNDQFLDAEVIHPRLEDSTLYEDPFRFSAPRYSAYRRGPDHPTSSADHTAQHLEPQSGSQGSEFCSYDELIEPSSNNFRNYLVGETDPYTNSLQHSSIHSAGRNVDDSSERASLSDLGMPSSSDQRKRQRLGSTGGSAHKRTRVRLSLSPEDGPDNIEEIDLSREAGSAEALLDKERQELVQTQQKNKNQEGLKGLGEMTCIICLDNFTNLTATACGHIFCHECLTQALIAGERNSDRHNVGNCPMCRKPLKRTKKNDLIPLVLMTKTKYQAATRAR